MAFNYNVGGLQADLAGAMLKGAQKRALDRQAEEDERRRQAKQREALRKDQQEALTEHAFLLAQTDPNFDFQQSDISTRLAGMDIDLWKKVDDALGGIPERRKQVLYQSAYENYLLGRQQRWDMVESNLEQRAALLDDEANDANSIQTREALELVREGKYSQAQAMLEGVVATGVATKYLNIENPLEWESYAPITGDDGVTRVVSVGPMGDVRTTDTGMRGRTEEEKAAARIAEAEATARAEGQEALRIQLRTEANESQRVVDTQERRLNEIQAYFDGGGDTGIPRWAKQQIARLGIPIDGTAEAGAVESALVQAAITELQNFKGPTTDFEFGRTERVTGTLGDSTLSNKGKLAALQRLTYLQKERNQFIASYLKDAAGADVADAELAWNNAYQRKQFEDDEGNQYSYADLQRIAAENTLTMQDVMGLLKQRRGM